MYAQMINTCFTVQEMRRSRTGGPVKSAKNAHNVEEVFNMIARGASKQAKKLNRLQCYHA